MADEQATGPQLRILQCFSCRSMEELPDYPAEANPDDDVTLHYLDEKHGGRTQQPHHRTLLRIEKRVWDDRAARRQIVERAWESTSGFKPSYYDIKATLQEDAVNCHRAHQRQVPCIDWRDSSKRLTAPTQGDRERLARDLPRSFRGDRERIAKGAPTQFLCDYCPVSVAVEHAKRRARGEA